MRRKGLFSLSCPAAHPGSGSIVWSTPDHLGTHGSVRELSTRLGYFYTALRCLMTQEHRLRKQHWGGEPALKTKRCHQKPGSALQRFGLASSAPQMTATTARRSHCISQGCAGGPSPSPPGRVSGHCGGLGLVAESRVEGLAAREALHPGCVLAVPRTVPNVRDLDTAQALSPPQGRKK